jgi:hypothetical protein
VWDVGYVPIVVWQGRVKRGITVGGFGQEASKQREDVGRSYFGGFWSTGETLTYFYKILFEYLLIYSHRESNLDLLGATKVL